MTRLLNRSNRLKYFLHSHRSTLAAFAVDAVNGSLSPIGFTPTEAQPRGFNIDPSGRFLFAVGQASHRLSSYVIDGQNGDLRKLGDCAVGRNPNWVEVVPLV